MHCMCAKTVEPTALPTEDHLGQLSVDQQLHTLLTETLVWSFVRTIGISTGTL
jgi:hypothetical protein